MRFRSRKLHTMYGTLAGSWHIGLNRFQFDINDGLITHYRNIPTDRGNFPSIKSSLLLLLLLLLLSQKTNF